MEYVKLSEVADIKQGYGMRQRISMPKDGVVANLHTLSSLASRGPGREIIIEESTYLRHELKENDILLAVYGKKPQITLWPDLKNSVVCSDLFRVRVYSEKIKPEFLYYYLKHARAEIGRRGNIRRREWGSMGCPY